MNLEDARRLSEGRPDDNQAQVKGSPKAEVPDFVFRFRYLLHFLVYLAGFGITWAAPRWGGVQRVWLSLPEAATAHLTISLQSAIAIVTSAATILALLGAILRTWGAAYLSIGAVLDSKLHSGHFEQDGPFRYVRNPLYLGTILHTLAVSVLMVWAGAVFVVVAIVALQTTLIFSEERFLKAKLGEVYEDYKQRVPRLVPRFTSGGTAIRTEAHWRRAIGGEIYMWGTAASFAMFGSNFNGTAILQGMVVSFGLAIALRGIIGNAEASPPGPA